VTRNPGVGGFQTRPYWMPVNTGMTIGVVAEFFKNFSDTTL
jgi:hypothetical protein